MQKPQDDPQKLANHLVELMSTKLVAALQKAGYSAVRMRGGDARPDSGVQIRGLFAEVDSENHWRRAVIRTATDNGKMQALVAVANLAKPDQALYEIANLPGNEDKPGRGYHAQSLRSDDETRAEQRRERRRVQRNSAACGQRSD